MPSLAYIFSHLMQASRIFWRALTRGESPKDPIAQEELRLRTLRIAIGLYKIKYGRFPAILRDLCDNNYDDPEWRSPFIPWSGEDTFRDSFGYRYEYEASAERSTVVSPGLERAKRRAARLGASPANGPAVSPDSSEATEGPPSEA